MSSLNGFEFYYLAKSLEGFFFGEMSYNCWHAPSNKQLWNYPILGIYSGIFAIYCWLHYQASNKETDKAKSNIIFYALSVLYVLSVALFIIELIGSAASLSVSDCIFFSTMVIESVCAARHRSGVRNLYYYERTIRLL